MSAENLHMHMYICMYLYMHIYMYIYVCMGLSSTTHLVDSWVLCTEPHSKVKVCNADQTYPDSILCKVAGQRWKTEIFDLQCFFSFTEQPYIMHTTCIYMHAYVSIHTMTTYVYICIYIYMTCTCLCIYIYGMSCIYMYP